MRLDSRGDLESLQMEEARDHLAVVTGYLDPAAVERLRQKALAVLEAHGTERDKVVGGKPGEYGERRRYKDIVADADVLALHFPEIMGFYLGAIGAAIAVTGRQVILSPFGKSAVTLKLYRGAGSQHGWHLETNNVTGLLYLTDHPEELGEGAMEWVRPGEAREAVRRYWPRAGDMAFMQGMDVWHRVAPLKVGLRERMVVVMNYYVEGEVSRPAGLDALHYA